MYPPNKRSLAGSGFSVAASAPGGWTALPNPRSGEGLRSNSGSLNPVGIGQSSSYWTSQQHPLCCWGHSLLPLASAPHPLPVTKEGGVGCNDLCGPHMAGLGVWEFPCPLELASENRLEHSARPSGRILFHLWNLRQPLRVSWTIVQVGNSTIGWVEDK